MAEVGWCKTESVVGRDSRVVTSSDIHISAAGLAG